MPRTTLDIERAVLEELKKVQRQRGGTLGAIASELLARVLKTEPASKPPAFVWKSQRMGAKIDIADRAAVYEALDRDHGTS